jgi:hypothetical protein
MNLHLLDFLQPTLTSYLSSTHFPPQPHLKTLSLRSSINVREQDSYPYKTTFEIIVVYIFIFMFVVSKQEDKIF